LPSYSFILKSTGHSCRLLSPTTCNFMIGRGRNVTVSVGYGVEKAPPVPASCFPHQPICFVSASSVVAGARAYVPSSTQLLSREAIFAKGSGTESAVWDGKETLAF